MSRVRSLKWIASAFVLFGLIMASLYFGYREENRQRQFEESRGLAEVEIPTPEPVAEQETNPAAFETPLPRNTTLHQILVDRGVSPAEIHRLVVDTRPVYNLARVRAGRRVLIDDESAGRLNRLEYDISDEEYLVVRRDGDSYAAERVRRRFDLVETTVSGEIATSLWDSLISQGEREGLVASLADVFQWDVDFSALQKRDSYEVLIDKKFLEGTFVGYGAIAAARFTTGGRTFSAFRFKNPGSGVDVYYDDKGNAVRKAFLKAPFSFNPRITSRFSYRRYHPVHKVWRPHLGVDYGAPSGTRVLASASGRVTLAGWKGGFGKQVRVRHANGYTTMYGHLSRISVKAGQTISQGQQIGRVGATGVATGPHLDYRIQDARGKFLNPRKMVALPSDKPVEKRYRDQFLAARDDLIWRLHRSEGEGCEVESLLAGN